MSNLGFRTLGSGFRTLASIPEATATQLADQCKVLGDLWFGDDTNGPKLLKNGSTGIEMRSSNAAKFIMGPTNFSSAAMYFQNILYTTSSFVYTTSTTAGTLFNIFDDQGGAALTATIGTSYKFLFIKNAGSSALTVNPSTGTIDGASSDSIAAGEAALYYNNATEWKRFGIT